MEKMCKVTQKTSQKGNAVSHSNVKTIKRFKVNLQTKRLLNPATGKIVKIEISTKGLKTLAKWEKEGKKYDLRDYV